MYNHNKANPQLNTSVYIYEKYMYFRTKTSSPQTTRSHLAVMPLTYLLT
jgi:hypothetical protein